MPTIGYWAHIATTAAEASSPLFSGSLHGRPQLCACPACAGDMFPVFTLSREFSVLPTNDNFYANGFMTFDVCPHCTHALNNYAVRYSQGVRQAIGGCLDAGGRINRIDQPYQSRAVSLSIIDEAFWFDEERRAAYHDRRLLEGVYHQFGGRQLKENRRPCDLCQLCGSAIRFFACIDYDDLNIPLHENGEPFALVIGDKRSLNLFACERCAAVNYCMSE